MSLCPGCARRDAVNDDLCRECAGQHAFELADIKPCGICGSKERNRFNQCMRCLRRRARELYRRSHNIPLTAPLMTKADAGRRSAEARKRKTA